MTEIWNSVATTPAATHRVPVDRSSSSSPAHWTGQQIADVRAYIGETVNSLGSISTNQSLSLADGRYIAATIAGNVQFTFTSVPAGATEIFLELTDGGAHTVSFAASLTWTGGTVPSLPTSGVALLHLRTRDGGTTYLANMVSDEQSFDAAAVTSGVFAAARLPTPTTTALGGVKRNTGSAGQYVTGIDTDGSLLLDTPAGGGLSEPLTTPRFTGQTSQPSAASAGEAKLHSRLYGTLALPAIIAEFGDALILTPPVTSPMWRGVWVSTGATFAGKTNSTAHAGVASTSSTMLAGKINAPNWATAASANSTAGFYNNSLVLSEGSSFGDGYLTYGLFYLPDATYTGGSGVKIYVGVFASGVIPSSSARPTGRCAGLEFNVAQGDTTWQALVYDTALRQANTGLAVTPQKHYFYVVHQPRGSSSTYFYIRNIEDGTTGSATLAYRSGSSALGEMQMLVTLDATARNFRSAGFGTIIGGAL